jgi:hypothetical protein
MLVHSCQPLLSYERISLLIVNYCHVPSTRIIEWLPQIVHFNIFVLAHENANEPAGVLPLWQNSGSSCVKCYGPYGRCNTAFSDEFRESFKCMKRYETTKVMSFRANISTQKNFYFKPCIAHDKRLVKNRKYQNLLSVSRSYQCRRLLDRS